MPAVDPAATTREQPPGNRPGPAPQPIATPETSAAGFWSQFVKSLAVDPEFLLLAGALAALCGWFVLESGPEVSRARSEAPAHGRAAAADGAGPSFQFATPQARMWLLPALGEVVGPVEHADPGPAASVVQHALLAEPVFDPLGVLLLTGLPPAARLSAGTPIVDAAGEPGGWALAFGDLDNLVIALPRMGAEPFAATLDLRSRSGVKISTLTIRIEEGVAPASVAEPGFKAKLRPAKSVKPTKSQRKTARPSTAAAGGTQAPVYPGDAPKAGVAAQPVLAGPAPLAGSAGGGLFKPDPKDTASSGLTPALREDPRFMTLRGLGMPPPEPVLPAKPQSP